MSKKIKGRIVDVQSLSSGDIEMMYELMDTFYDNMTKKKFLRDLSKKDYCIVLRDENTRIWGFSTQQIMHIPVGEKVANGVFSGDTIIHKDYWGSMELFIVFAKFFFEFEEQYGDFYWFLICKGYKTYRMLPTFYNIFYPNYKEETPEEVKAIMDAFGKYYSIEEYDEKTGVICYKGIKDKLKENYADISEERLSNKNIAFFASKNPGYINGDEIVCITKLTKSNLKPRVKRLLLG